MTERVENSLPLEVTGDKPLQTQENLNDVVDRAASSAAQALAEIPAAPCRSDWKIPRYVRPALLCRSEGTGRMADAAPHRLANCSGSIWRVRQAPVRRRDRRPHLAT
jgi:hypothetical protein